MQLKSFIPLAFAGLAWSKPTVTERDLPTITNAINSVNGALQSLDSSINAFQGSGDVATLQQQSQNTIDTLNKAASDVSGSDSISITDALQIQTVSQTLVGTANTTVNDLIAKKPLLDQAGASGIVFQQIQQQQQAGQKLSDAIVSKVPQSVQQIAGQLTGQISDIMNRGVAAFQGSASSTAASSAPAASSAAPSSAAAASSAPAPTSASALASATTAPAGVTPPAGAAPTGASPCPDTPVSSSTASAATSTGTGSGSGSSGGGVSANCPCLQQLGAALTDNMDKRMVGMGDLLDKRLERLDNIGYMLEKRYMEIEKRHAEIMARA